MYATYTYITYILFSIFITVFVSRTLSKNGRIFLINGLDGDEALADSINHLLVVGFYLVNLGFVLLRMKTDQFVASFEEMIVYLASGLGFVLLILGIAHFFNMYVIHSFGKNYTKYSSRGPTDDSGESKLQSLEIDY